MRTAKVSKRYLAIAGKPTTQQPLGDPRVPRFCRMLPV